MKPEMTDEEVRSLIRSFPTVPEELAAFLEERYAPRTWDPDLEPAHKHHEYAGMVKLTGWLRAVRNFQSSGEELGLDPGAKHVVTEGGS